MVKWINDCLYRLGLCLVANAMLKHDLRCGGKHQDRIRYVTGTDTFAGRYCMHIEIIKDDPNPTRDREELQELLRGSDRAAS